MYKAEVLDGLQEAINKNFVVICSQLVASEADKEEYKKSVAALIHAEANENFDLYPLNSILVSTGWNKNADIFDKYETWAARKTPANKPLNIGHDQTKIRGHITSSVVIDETNKVVDDESTIDDVPNFFHILNSAFLYKVWKPTEIQEEMDVIIAEIEKGEWCVSMECLFRGFDYGIIDLDGSQKIIQRNESTAFLTKYLSAYGGAGEYQGRKIGRLLRNITFSGKGLVKNPANPYSIIIIDKFAGTTASINDIGDTMSQNVVDEKLNEKIGEISASLVESTSKLATAEAENKNLKQTVASLELAKKTAEDALAVSEAKVIGLDATIAELNTKIAELDVKFAAANTELNTIRAEAKKTTRLAAIKEKGKTAEEAEALFAKFENLDDKTFAEVVSLIEAKVATPTETVDASELETVVAETAVVTTPVVDAAESTIADVREYLKSQITKSK